MKTLILILLSYFFLNLVFTLAFPEFSLADTSNSNTSSNGALAVSNISANELINKSKFVNNFSMQRTNSLFDQYRNEYVASVDLSYSLSYNWNPTTTSVISLDYSKDLINSENSDFGKGVITQKKKYDSFLFNFTQGTLKFNLGIPISKLDQKDKKIGSIGIGTDFTVINRPSNFSAFTPSFRLGITRNIFQFERRADQTVLTAYTFNQTADINYSFEKWKIPDLNFTFSYTHISAWNFENQIKEFYTHSEEFSYSYNSTLSFSFGHSYGLPVVNSVKSNGDRNDFKSWDEKYSLVYAGLSVLL